MTSGDFYFAGCLSANNKFVRERAYGRQSPNTLDEIDGSFTLGRAQVATRSCVNSVIIKLQLSRLFGFLF